MWHELKTWVNFRFCRLFDVPCMKRNSTEQVRKNIFNWALGIEMTHDASTRNDALLWTGELREINHARCTWESDNVFNWTTLAILSATMRLRHDFRLESAWFTTLFLTSQHGAANNIFFTHGTSNNRQKPEITQVFNSCHIMVYCSMMILQISALLSMI